MEVVKDALGVACLFGMVYAVGLIGYGFGS